jgi:benzodiazapine receptor
MKKILLFISSVVICQLAGFIGSIFTTPAIPIWYAGLNKPSFNPPNWVFAPVWTALFLMMGIALYLMLRRWTEKQGVTVALMAFTAQLVFNIGWSILFFGLKSPLAGFIWIIALWLAILITLIAFWRVTKAGAVLLMPYIIWVSFAAVLNFFLWRLN